MAAPDRGQDGGDRPSAQCDCQRGRPVAADPFGHRHGAGPGHDQPHLRRGTARPGLLPALDGRLGALARPARRAGIHTRLGRSDHGPAAGGDRSSRRSDRHGRRLHDLRQPRNQPAFQRHPDQPRADVPGGDDRQLGASRRRLLQRLVGHLHPGRRAAGAAGRAGTAGGRPVAGRVAQGDDRSRSLSRHRDDRVEQSVRPVALAGSRPRGGPGAGAVRPFRPVRERSERLRRLRPAGGERGPRRAASAVRRRNAASSGATS